MPRLTLEGGHILGILIAIGIALVLILEIAELIDRKKRKQLATVTRKGRKKSWWKRFQIQMRWDGRKYKRLRDEHPELYDNGVWPGGYY